MADLRIDPGRAALLVVDIQDKLHAAMAEPARRAVERYVPVLVELARRFAMPVVVSEQYPRGLGPTIDVVEQAVASVGELAHRFEKVDFSVCATEPFAAIWDRLARDQWIVVGMETHVCVYQSVRGLIERGASVQVPRDAVASRTVENLEVGLGLLDRTGAVITSTETVVFDLLRRAEGDDFKALSRLIR